jgi:hypothetical protein
VTPVERRYKDLVDRFGELEISPTRYAHIAHSTLFRPDPEHPIDLVQAPLAYPLRETPGLELRIRPFLVLILASEDGEYVYRFKARLGADVVPELPIVR